MKNTPADTPIPETVTNDYAGQVLFIFGEGFDHRHYDGARRSLEKAGYKVLVASSTTAPLEGIITGHGFELTSQIGASTPIIKPDLMLEDVRVADFQAVIFISDSGLLADQKATINQIISKAAGNNVVLAAQEFSIYHLAELGLLKGVKVTANPLICQELETVYEAECTLMPVQHDQCIVTADPTYSTVSFVRGILAEIENCGG